MELRHLRYFVAIAEAGTVSGAATRLHVTQPSLSRQLRQLERELGVELFDLVGRRFTLSPAGRTLLPLARDVLGRADAVRAAAAFHRNGRLERLTIGAPAVTLTDVVAPFIATLAAEDPTTDVLGADGLSAAETLRLGADLAIGTARGADPYRSQPLAVLPVWAYVPVGHRWQDREEVTLAELIAEPLIVLPPASTARQALEHAVASIGAGLNTGSDVGGGSRSVTEAANGTVAQALAAAGRGVAVVTDDPRFGLVPLAVDLGGRRLSIRLVVVWDSRHAAAATVEEFAARLGRFVRDRYNAPAD
ncbi:putative LysR-family transcriptional regulator [Actinoplanes missouriensis 431]|uniref:Putative LysR-family transcriptional regulator n=1 Tax=Actinoplanes missouriensis (strain ATCC 14538 / DSM 43046 / CBS 188.64 / JCM 3121 / NBRC 102363 / NCIMB 12654 / NRRL B-3342 / UNCC 431) TaxID=512565 RepID=I0H3N2_ACTM4|nr:LysR family transcriptional regulator [Actinoplanes missouriensis]BAL87619.1 putative LysR-family transcriptional regulator [Actinoplanes missouriensis 431]